MYIAMQCSDSNGALNTEVCTFYGIRYDSRYRSAVISTEHLNHDYVVPMDPSDYENAVKQIMEAMKGQVELINIEQGVVYRGRKGESRHVDPQKLVIKPV
ncbi:MAG: hypothetical protein IKO84_06410 [Butyrivibrio sp.]|nr:hypothetical protein [Butyrivibrio sp.]